MHPVRDLTSAAAHRLESQRVRAEIRAGREVRTSRGMALGHVQCNLVILPKAYAFDFMLYCQRNQRACPVLEVLDPGSPEPKTLAPGADLRTDVARYAVLRDGVKSDERLEIANLWQDDFVSFLIGSGITFDQALERAGVPAGRLRWVVNTTQPTAPAGPFSGNLVVTMRLLKPEQAIVATQGTSRFPFNHGAPIDLGDPDKIGADLKNPLFDGPVPADLAGLMPVFWACGVTPQAAAEAAKLPIMITHAPVHSFITDMPADLICTP